jgi:hypothetical protein
MNGTTSKCTQRMRVSLVSRNVPARPIFLRYYLILFDNGLLELPYTLNNSRLHEKDQLSCALGCVHFVIVHFAITFTLIYKLIYSLSGKSELITLELYPFQ